MSRILVWYGTTGGYTRKVANAIGDTDTSRDYEYSDWNDLRAFAGEFGRSVERTAA